MNWHRSLLALHSRFHLEAERWISVSLLPLVKACEGARYLRVLVTFAQVRCFIAAFFFSFLCEQYLCGLESLAKELSKLRLNNGRSYRIPSLASVLILVYSGSDPLRADA